MGPVGVLTLALVAVTTACLASNYIVRSRLKAKITELSESEKRYRDLAVELSCQTKEARRMADEMATLYNIGLATTSTLDLEEVLRLIHCQTQHLMDAGTFYVALFDEANRFINFEFFIDKGKALEKFGRPFSEDKGLTEWIIKNKKPLLIKDMFAKDRTPAVESIPIGDIPKSIMGVPLVARGGIIGVLSVQSYERSLGEEELRLLSMVGTQAAVAIENARLYEELKAKNAILEENRQELQRMNTALDQELAEVTRLHRMAEQLAITDPVTGLYNHRYFQERLEEEIARAERYGRYLSLVMIDIDYFKNYNDIHGHQAGDAVLKAVGRLIERSVRSTDIVARYGGEEFVVILLEAGRREAYVVADKIRIQIEAYPFPNEETQPQGKLTVSVGISTYPDDAKTKRELIELADVAMYRGKKDGGNKIYRTEQGEIGSFPISGEPLQRL